MENFSKKINLSVISTYLVLVIITVVALAAIKEFDIAYPLRVTSAYPATELSAVGEGKVEVVPDTATVTAGITVSGAKDVASAEKQVNEVNNKIIVAMKNLGIDKKDIKTSDYSIYPNYSYEKTQQIEGYNANATVIVKTHRLDQAEAIISSLTEAGANQIQGVQFSIDDMSKVRVMARDRAIADAKKQAKELADKLDIKLGKVTNIIESPELDEPMPYMSKSYEARDVAVAEPSAEIEPGSQTVTSTVTLFFEKQ